MAILCNNVSILTQQAHEVGKNTSKETVIRGDRLKNMRELKRFTQDELSEYAGIAKSQLSRYENGHTDPAAFVLKKLAERLDCTTDYLLGLSDDPETSYRPEKKYPIELQIIIAKYLAGQLDEIANELLTESLRRKKLNSSNNPDPDDKNSVSKVAQ